MPKAKQESESAQPAPEAGPIHIGAGLEQVRALAHPLRLRLFEMFAQRPRTTKQAADELGEAPTRLYHHVAALEKAGLVRVRETRRKRGTTEKYFEAVSHSVMPEAQSVVHGGKRDHAAVGFVVFDQARNELVQALAAGPDETKTLMAVRAVVRLSPSQAKRMGKELRELLKRLVAEVREQSPRTRKKRSRYSLTIALVPADQGAGDDA
ncbi:MAG TPA: helix-turn-helix domain-containing protein [Thermoanaerobaculia bacterium]|nr:helix-turn-helix domain-containing protein [Thermoanaerobaculia bacterium]